LPCLRFESKRKPNASILPKNLYQLVDIKNKMTYINLLQRDVAKIFGVSTDYVSYWENNSFGISAIAFLNFLKDGLILKSSIINFKGLINSLSSDFFLFKPLVIERLSLP
jgi:transcriptional regulator with XRE-family HTH domain